MLRPLISTSLCVALVPLLLTSETLLGARVAAMATTSFVAMCVAAVVAMPSTRTVLVVGSIGVGMTLSRVVPGEPLVRVAIAVALLLVRALPAMVAHVARSSRALTLLHLPRHLIAYVRL